MKKILFLITMIIAMVLVVGCEKDEVTPKPQQTFEKMYHDWKNLTWVSTTENGVEITSSPTQLKLTIIGDSIIHNKIGINSDYNYYNKSITYDGLQMKYTNGTKTEGTVIFFIDDDKYTNPKNDKNVYIDGGDTANNKYSWEKNGDYIFFTKLTTTYILEIN